MLNILKNQIWLLLIAFFCGTLSSSLYIQFFVIPDHRITSSESYLSEPVQDTQKSVYVMGDVITPGTIYYSSADEIQTQLDAGVGLTATSDVARLDEAILELGNYDSVLIIGKQSESQSCESSGGLPTSELVNINTASVEQLATLPRVGEVTAQRIIEGRPYLHIGDLLRVKGIGDKTLENMKDKVGI